MKQLSENTYEPEDLEELKNRLIQLGKIETKLEVAQRKFIHVEKKYQSLIDNIIEAIFKTDEMYLLTFLNPAWQEFTGFSAEESIGTNFLDYMYPQDRERIKELYELLMQRKREYCRLEIRYLTRNGGYRWSEIYARLTLDNDDNILGISGTLTDIVERKAMEKELKKHRNCLDGIVKERTISIDRTNERLQQEIVDRKRAENMLKRYQLLSNNTRDIILFIGIEGNILEANNAAVRVYGYTYNELINMPITDIVVFSENMKDLPISPANYSQGDMFEEFHKKKDGTNFPVEVSSEISSFENEEIILLVIRDITERKQTEEQLKYLATHDFLTKIPNRYYLVENLKKVIENARQNNTTSTLLCIDLDNFKVINDTFGHSVGDNLLISFVAILQSKLTQKHFLARLGGDEFAILLEGMSITEAKNVAESLRLAVESDELCLVIDSVCFNITLSIGIALIDGQANFERVLSFADIALYTAKEEGKNRIVDIQENSEKTRLYEYNQKVSEIKDAIRDGRFILYYQPVFKLGKGIIHHEALVRMIGTNSEIIYPNSFIPVAERFGLMSQIERWVFAEAIRFLKENTKIKLFINLSGNSLGDESLLSYIEKTIKHSGIDPNRLGFEITETTAVKNLIKAEHWISRIKSLGCKFALDDFGIGFSSFSYLQMLPVDYLKIDGSFVRNLDINPTQKAVVQAINAVAHALGKETIAEFVENEKIVEILQELNVDFGQGYYLGKPTRL